MKSFIYKAARASLHAGAAVLSKSPILMGNVAKSIADPGKTSKRGFTWLNLGLLVLHFLCYQGVEPACFIKSVSPSVEYNVQPHSMNAASAPPVLGERSSYGDI
jgi:hypothetical protein